MYRFTYKDTKTGKNVYSNIQLNNNDLVLVAGVKTTEINPVVKPTKARLKKVK